MVPKNQSTGKSSTLLGTVSIWRRPVGHGCLGIFQPEQTRQLRRGRSRSCKPASSGGGGTRRVMLKGGDTEGGRGLEHVELARCRRERRRCSGCKKIPVLVISVVTPARKRLWLNPPRFFHLKYYMSRGRMEDTIYACCFGNMRDRGKHHLWRCEVEGVTSAMTGSRSCFDYSASAPAVSAEMCSGPWD